jgi:DNA/RNA-binding domain of Phe-tRNA-synthetase-like protein
VYFEHADEIWRGFPDLVPGAVYCAGISRDADVTAPIAHYYAIAGSRLERGSESELPEIQAWRRAFAKMGLKPTQYRCASESLLRRFRKEKSLPSIHPLVDLCNAMSMAFAIPVAVYDTASVDQYLQVRHAKGDETYLTFSGGTENPEPAEVIFADAASQAHARRWTNRQSLRSAIQPETKAVLIVAEALHSTAQSDLPRLTTAISDALGQAWSTTPVSQVLHPSSPRFDFAV